MQNIFSNDNLGEFPNFNESEIRKLLEQCENFNSGTPENECYGFKSIIHKLLKANLQFLLSTQISNDFHLHRNSMPDDFLKEIVKKFLNVLEESTQRLRMSDKRKPEYAILNKAINYSALSMANRMKVLRDQKDKTYEVNHHETIETLKEVLNTVKERHH